MPRKTPVIAPFDPRYERSHSANEPRSVSDESSSRAVDSMELSWSRTGGEVAIVFTRLNSAHTKTPRQGRGVATRYHPASTGSAIRLRLMPDIGGSGPTTQHQRLHRAARE